MAHVAVPPPGRRRWLQQLLAPRDPNKGLPLQLQRQIPQSNLPAPPPAPPFDLLLPVPPPSRPTDRSSSTAGPGGVGVTSQQVAAGTVYKTVDLPIQYGPPGSFIDVAGGAPPVGFVWRVEWITLPLDVAEIPALVQVFLMPNTYMAMLPFRPLDFPNDCRLLYEEYVQHQDFGSGGGDIPNTANPVPVRTGLPQPVIVDSKTAIFIQIEDFTPEWPYQTPVVMLQVQETAIT